MNGHRHGVQTGRRLREFRGFLSEGAGVRRPRPTRSAFRRLGRHRMPNWAIVTVVAGVFTCIGQSAAQTAPAVTSVSFINSPLSGDTYEFGARIDLRVEFDENVQVAYLGSPQLTLGIGATTRQARYWYYSGKSLYFAHIVQAEDVDSNGISVPADALSGASITLAGDPAVAVDLSHEAVADDPHRKVDGRTVSAPKIDGVFFPDDQPPRNGETYGLGEEVAVSVSFDKAVAVTGLPQMMIQVGSESRETTHWHHGADLGSRGTKITFYYTVQSEDVDSDGVSVPANAVSLKGGSIALVDHADINANLSHDRVPDHPNRKVDGSLGPKVTGVSFMGRPDSGDTYTLGETIEVLVELDQSVRFDFRTRLAVAIGERTRQAALSRSVPGSGSSVTFEYLVQAADLDGDGISIPANAMTLNGGSVTADLSHEAVDADPNRKVNGSIAVAPKIASISFSTRPQRAGDGNGFPVHGDTYGLGEAIEVWVNFDKPVRATGNLQVGLAVGRSVRHAVRSSPYRAISFDYVVQPGDSDSDGISIPANALTLNGGAITMQGDTSIVADLTHDAVAGEHKVDGSAVDAPRVLWGAFSFQVAQPANGEAFGRGETIEVLFFLDRRVKVNGEPHLALEIGGRTRQASFRELFVRGSLVLLFFEYIVQAEDMDSDGIGLPANALNGGSITLEGDAATVADLTHDAIKSLYGSFKVDGSTVVRPTVLRPLVYWQPASGGSYSLGETIYAEACFSGGVLVSGRPQMALQIGGAKRQASRRGSFLGCPLFQYRVEAGDLDENDISIPASALTLNGGSIVLAGDSSVAADLTHDAFVPTDGLDRRVDGSTVVAPRVTGVSFTGKPVGGDTYGQGEKIGVRVAFDKVLDVSGEPRLALTVGARTREATFVRQEMSDVLRFFDDIFVLFFEYTVQPGDMDADGISVSANALSLNGGSLTLMGAPGTAADLSHSAVNPDETRLVDAPDTAPTFSTAIAGQVFVLTEAVSLVLPEATGGDGELTYSLSPALPPGLTFDPATRLLWGMPVALADLMAFEYTVTDGDLEDPESATLTFSMSVIAQPATEVGGESAGEDAVEVTWRGPWTDPSRGRLVIEARSPSMDWTVVGTVDPSSGEFIVSGLAPETPYTFRLRFESAPGVAGRSASVQASTEYSEEFSVTTGSYTGPCRSGGKYLCLRSGRFELRADWTNPDQAGEFGAGTAVPVDISDESGLFWFFDPANIELVTKVLDGSRLNGHYWMFFGALSDVEYWLTLRDTAAGGSQRTYHNPPKEVCGQSDTRAFPGDLAALLGLSSSTEEFSGLAGLDPVRVSAVSLDLIGVPQTDDSAGQCEPTANRLCLLGNRFAIDVIFIDPNIK